jgi:type 1 fimbriae regulatory protein FimB/type 1 fimbriae regulatory protein FimE
MTDREQQVRERVYYTWEAEERPQGRAEIHWAMAEIATAVLSYLSLLANQGVDTRSLQQYLGAQNIQHTVRYTELSTKRFRDFWKD